MAADRTARLGEAPVGRLLLSMAAQTTAATLLYSVYSLVDTIYVARGIGSTAAGGLAVSFPLLILLAGISTTLGSGSASLVSRALGRQDIARASMAAANAFLIFYAAAALITLCGLIWLDPLLSLMGVTAELRPYAHDYLQVMLIGAASGTAFSSIIRAEGNTRFAMLLWIIPVAVNIVLDPVFIFALQGGVRGAAIATVISQLVSVAMSAWYFFKSGRSALRIGRGSFRPDGAVIREIISVGLPSLLQMVSLSISVVLINNLLRDLGGALAISCYGIVTRFLAFLIIPQSGVSQALQPMVGFNAAAGRPERVRRAVILACLDILLYGLLITALVQLFPGFWIGLFTTEPAVLSLGAQILTIVTLVFPVSGIAGITAAHFQALGRARPALLLALAQNVLILAPVALLLAHFFGLNGIWYASPATSLATFALSVGLLYWHRDGPRRFQREIQHDH